MTLPSSGAISMDQIRAELGVPGQAPFSLYTAQTGGYATINTWSPSYPPNGGPYALNQWYGYNHNEPVPQITSFSVNGFGDPIYGTFEAYWSEANAGAITLWYLWYSFDYGSSWQLYNNYGQSVYGSGIQSVEGYFGFTSLDNTYFRLTAEKNALTALGSPQYAYPPFPY